ncbi:MAG: hypothetical protein GOV02_02760 [Candidatus Aenigmarchaeota archaeon]|nr:hypothetical protein [Candidatus Aenigmarchaeota archaeon]
MNETVQIIFLGKWGHIDRIKYLLRTFIPHKVYFIYRKDATNQDIVDIQEDMQKELEKELPDWVKKRSEKLSLPLLDFQTLFPEILKIMAKEINEGNEVIANIHGTSVVGGVASTMAAALTGAKVYGVTPKKFEVVNPGDKRKIYKTVGAKGYYEIKIPLLPAMPSGSEKAVLEHASNNDGSIKGKLSKLAEDVGLENLGANVKKASSGIVKLSKTIGKLREQGLVETRRIGRKNFEISLTEKGKMMAEVSSALSA